VWLVVGVAVLALGYFVAAPFAGELWSEWRRERQWRAERERQDRERQDRERAYAERRARERDAGAPSASAATAPEPPVELPPPEPPEESNEALAARIREASGADRRTLLGKDLAKRASDLWGPGFSGALRQLAKVSDADLELAILPALGPEAQSSGCGDAFKKARDAEPKAQSSGFAKGCPPASERRAIAPKRLRDVPLWAGALAVLLELRARDRSMTDDPLHRAVLEALLAERVP
jgi:hypothetical protein